MRNVSFTSEEDERACGVGCRDRLYRASTISVHVVIAAASAFQYPRARLLAGIAARLVRYSLLGWRRSGSDGRSC